MLIVCLESFLHLSDLNSETELDIEVVDGVSRRIRGEQAIAVHEFDDHFETLLFPLELGEYEDEAAIGTASEIRLQSFKLVKRGNERSVFNFAVHLVQAEIEHGFDDSLLAERLVDFFDPSTDCEHVWICVHCVALNLFVESGEKALEIGFQV